MTGETPPGAESGDSPPSQAAEEPIGAAESTGEISMVIRALRDADMRLQELTGGKSIP